MHTARGPKPAAAYLPRNVEYRPVGRFGNGFFMTPHWLVRDGYWASLMPADRAVFVAIADHADYKTGVTNVTVRTIALESGMCEDSVSIATGRLEALGLVKKWYHKLRRYYHVFPSGEFPPAVSTAPDEPGSMSRGEPGTYPPATVVRSDSPSAARQAALAEHGSDPCPTSAQNTDTSRNKKRERQRILDPSDPEKRETVTEMIAALGPEKALADLRRSFDNDPGQLRRMIEELPCEQPPA